MTRTSLRALICPSELQIAVRQGARIVRKNLRVETLAQRNERRARLATVVMLGLSAALLVATVAILILDGSCPTVMTYDQFTRTL